MPLVGKFSVVHMRRVRIIFFFNTSITNKHFYTINIKLLKSPCMNIIDFCFESFLLHNAGSGFSFFSFFFELFLKLFSSLIFKRTFLDSLIRNINTHSLPYLLTSLLLYFFF